MYFKCSCLKIFKYDSYIECTFQRTQKDLQYFSPCGMWISIIKRGATKQLEFEFNQKEPVKEDLPSSNEKVWEKPTYFLRQLSNIYNFVTLSVQRRSDFGMIGYQEVSKKNFNNQNVSASVIDSWKKMY